MAQQTRDRVLAGRYRVLERLGSGGMAAVYLAEDQRLGRRVAVKRLHADSPDDAARRFAREAKLLASLNHPNVVGVFDTVTDGEGVLIVMEYVEGETLSDALRRGPLEPGRATEVIAGVAAALDHAHEHGVVHRDVKPANVLLGGGEQVKLADLGIARAAEGTQLTRTGTVLGTPSYMAPEQLEGRELTPAVDVYALAAMAWETLAGRKAREGRTPMEIAHRVASEPPPDLREAWPKAPPGAAEVLRRGMSRDPVRRPRSAGSLAGGLTAALEQGEGATAATRPLAAGAAAPSPPVAGARSRTERAAAPPPRRSRRGVAAAIPLALLVAVVAVVAGIAAGRGGDETPERGAGLPSQPEPEQAPQEDAAPPGDEDQPQPEQSGDPVAEGMELHDQGFALMNQERYQEAIPVLRESVSLLEDARPPQYWYSLFNLGRSLRLSGSPQEAIPVLEQRLQYAEQRETVEEELALAREEAGQGGGRGERGEDNGEGNGRGRGNSDRDDDD
ncbi:MAG: protein kinase [Thermoleophilaceae bacterium]